MPIYSNLGTGHKGISGYSGVNITEEIYPQNTFTPSHDKWNADYDMSFVGDVPTYNAVDEFWPEGELWCGLEDLLQSLIVGDYYRFEWTLQNVVNGEEINGELYGTDTLGILSFTEGTSYIDFIWLDNQEWPPYPYFYSAAGIECSFEVVSMSLKPLLLGYSGYSGIEASDFPQACPKITAASSETLVQKFNLLLDELIDKGWMEAPPE